MVEKKKILVVDDKIINRFIIKNVFNDEYDTIECENGYEAMNALQEYKESIAVVLLDIVMPSCDGFAVLRYMQEHKLQMIVPVVLISSNVTKENIQKAYAYEVADYIQKPFQDVVLKSRVKSVIRSFENEREMQKKSIG